MGCGHRTALHRGCYETSESLVRLRPASVSQLSSRSFCVPVSLCDNTRQRLRTVTTYGHPSPLFFVSEILSEMRNAKKGSLSVIQ